MASYSKLDAIYWVPRSCVEKTLSLVQMNLSALVQYFWYITCQWRPKFELNQSFLYIHFLFGLFSFGLAQITVLRSLSNFPAWIQTFWYQTCHYWPTICLKPLFHQYFCFSFVLFVFSMAQPGDSGFWLKKYIFHKVHFWPIKYFFKPA